MFFGIAGGVVGVDLDGLVEAVEIVEESVAAEVARGEGVDYFFDLRGDYVAAAEVGIVEDAAEDALGEQVLDEHLRQHLRRGWD